MTFNPTRLKQEVVVVLVVVARMQNAAVWLNGIQGWNYMYAVWYDAERQFCRYQNKIVETERVELRKAMK